jgi:hypothetical protein
MALTIACATCGKQLRLPEMLVGQLVACPSCHKSFTVTDNSGVLNVQPALEDIPAVLPAPRASARPPGPLADPASRPADARAFIFRVVVVHDPQRRLFGDLQARASATGLELRARDDRLYHFPVGTPARHVGGNVFRVELDGREVALRIVQRQCQQAHLAQDIVKFLNGQRPALRLADYVPRKAVALLALVPLLLPAVAIGAWVGGTLGVFAWLLLGLVLVLISWCILRNEARTYRRRLAVAGLVWAVSLVLVVPLAAVVNYYNAQVEAPRLTWRQYTSPDGRWQASMPGNIVLERRPLPGGVLAATFDVARVQLPASRGSFEVWATEYTPNEFDVLGAEARFGEIRSTLLSYDGTLRSTGEWAALQNGPYPSRFFNFENKAGYKMKVQVYLARPRVYVLWVTWRGKMDSKEVDRFFNHFRLSIGQEGQPDGNGKVVPPDDRGPPSWLPQPALQVRPVAATQFPGLLAYWKFNEGRGARAVDSSGRNPDSAIAGAWWINGIEGKALMFDGQRDCFDFSTAGNLNFRANASFTIAFWVATKEQHGPLLAMRNSANDASRLVVKVFNGALQAQVGGDTTPPGGYVLTGSGFIADQSWHHVALVRFEDGWIELHVDGISQGRQGINAQHARGTITTDQRALGFGRLNGHLEAGRYCACCVDEFCVFDRALTAQEIHSLAGKR